MLLTRRSIGQPVARVGDVLTFADGSRATVHRETVYQWNDASLADAYARALWRVVALVSTPASIHCVVVPGVRRDEVLANPPLPSPVDADLTAG